MNKPNLALKGQITTQNGKPLANATIQIEGTSISCTSNSNGFFELFFEQLPITLLVTHSWFIKTKIVTVTDNQEPIVIQLIPVIERIKERKENTPAKSRGGIAHSNKQMLASFNLGGGGNNLRRGRLKRYACSSFGGNSSRSPRTNREEYSALSSNEFLATSNKPFSTFSIDVDTAAYSNMRRFLQQGQLPIENVVRIEELLNYFTYDYPQPTSEHPFELFTEVSGCPWNSQHRLVHIGLQGKTIPTDHLPPSNLVFLLDVSGSMNNFNKLPLLKSSLKLLVQQLRSQDKVSIVTYANQATIALDATDGSNKQAIIEIIDSLNANGGTGGGQAIQQAYQLAKNNYMPDGNNRIILATDGDFNIGIRSEKELGDLIEKERDSGVYLTVLGFGMGNYKDNKLQVLANKGNGNHAYIDTLTEAKKVLVNEFGGTLFTIAKDVKIQVEFNPAHVQGYRLIGYEKRVMPPEDFRNDKKDAGELGAGHTVTALYEVIPVGVDSEWIGSVPNSKYQAKKEEHQVANHLEELLTVKFRYKQPDEDRATEFEKVVVDQFTPITKTSDDFRWTAAITTFGMLLRASKFRGSATLDMAIELAQGAKGKDINGYRRECLNLMEASKALIGDFETASNGTSSKKY